MSQSLGVVTVTWNGVQFDAEKGATFKQGGLVNKTTYAGGKAYYSQEPMASEIKCSTPYLASTSIAAILAPGRAELTFKCDTGQTYVMPSAWIIEQLEITGGEGGKLTLTWNSNAAEELL